MPEPRHRTGSRRLALIATAALGVAGAVVLAVALIVLIGWAMAPDLVGVTSW